MEQNNSNQKSWYKKKRYTLPLAILVLVLVLGFNNSSQTQQKLESTTIPVSGYNSSVNRFNSIDIPLQKAKSTPKCNKNYSGCLKPDVIDYDCAGGSGNGPYYTGTVQVLGYDEYKLDRDNDGWGCE